MVMAWCQGVYVTWISDAYVLYELSAVLFKGIIFMRTSNNSLTDFFSGMVTVINEF